MISLANSTSLSTNQSINSHCLSYASDVAYTSSLSKINDFLQREHAIDKLLAAFHIFSALDLNKYNTQYLSELEIECRHLNLIRKNTELELSENIKNLVINLNYHEIKSCKKLIYQSLQKEVSQKDISFQTLLNKWLALIDKACCENYARNNLTNRELIGNNLSLIKISLKSTTEIIGSYLQYLNLIENKYKNLATKLKKAITFFISTFSGVPAWQKLKGISPIFIPQLIQYLSIKEMMALRASNFWLYYEITKHIKSVKIYTPNEIEGKIKAFAPIGGINKIILTKERNSLTSYHSEDMQKIFSMLKDAESISNLKSIHFNDCNLNGIDFVSHLNNFPHLKSIKMKRVNLLPILPQKQISKNAFFSDKNNLANLTSIKIQNSYISKFLIISLSHLPNLRKLALVSNYFWQNKDKNQNIHSDEIFSFLKNLKQLKHLEIYNKEIKLSDNTLSYIQELKFLENLILFFCKGMTNEGLRRLFENSIKKIKELVLHDCPNINDEGIKYLSQSELNDLENIELASFNNLTDESLKYFSEIKNLKHLYLQDCPEITMESVKKINKSSDHLSISLFTDFADE